MTPKAVERLGRLDRRLTWLDERIAKRSATDQPAGWDAAEASALRWVIGEVRELDSMVERMPGEIAEWMTRCLPDGDGYPVHTWERAIAEAAQGVLGIDWRHRLATDSHTIPAVSSATEDDGGIDL